jgi:hypothetical protein
MPAWPRVCTGHLIEPSANSTRPKSGGVEYICANSLLASARRMSVSPPNSPPKCLASLTQEAVGARLSNGASALWTATP